MGIDFAAAGVASALEYASGAMNQRYALERQHQAQDFSAQQFATRYQTTVADLKAAGLNPMLAYQQGGGSPPGGSVAGPGGQVNFREAATQARIATAQAANIEADTEKKRAEIGNIMTDSLIKSGMDEKIAAETAQALQSAETAKQQALVYNKQITKMEQEIKTLQSQAEKNKADTQYADALKYTQWLLNSLKRAETLLYEREATLKQLEIDTMTPKAKASLTTSAEQGHWFEQGIGRVLKSVNPFK